MIDTKQLLDRNAIKNLTHVVEGVVCPNCNGEMRAWNHGKGGNVCIHEERRGNKLIWNGCGYKELAKRDRLDTQIKYRKIKESEAFNYLRANSITNNEDVLKRTLEGFNVINDVGSQALEMANRISNELTHKKALHALLIGPTGTGKTHLSVGIANKFLELSQYSERAMFISYAELYSQMQTMFQVPGAAQELERNILSEVRKADLVIIDDLGAELGAIDSQKDIRATDSNVRLLTRILEAREDKHLIVTTNLTGTDISREYGDRCLSRIRKNMKDDAGMDRVIKTAGLRDFRTA